MKHLIFNQFNFIKIFCCFLVVYQHIVGRFLASSKATTFTHLFYGTFLNFSRLAVPIFLLITGFLIIKSYENLSLKEFYKSKLSRIVYIYIAANLLFIVPRFFKGNYSLELFVRDIVWGKASSHLWYMHTLLKIYLVFPIFKYIVVYLNKWFKYKAIIFITVVQYFISNNAYSILSKETNSITKIMFMYLDRSLLIWGYYIILGGLIYKNFDLIYKFIYKYKKVIISLFVIDLLYINIYTFKPFNFDAINYYKSSPSSFKILIYSVLSFIVLYYIASAIVKMDNFKILQIIKRLTKYILAIYITHPIVVDASHRIMPFIDGLPHDLGALIIIILVMVCSIAPFYIYESKKKVRVFKVLEN